jgi:hypothetical protein
VFYPVPPFDPPTTPGPLAARLVRSVPQLVISTTTSATPIRTSLPPPHLATDRFIAFHSSPSFFFISLFVSFLRQVGEGAT